jgi:hypothetical protein
MIARQLGRQIVVLGITPVLATASGCQFPVDRTAKEAFRGGLGETSITVFPAFVRTSKGYSYDQAAAEKIGAFLTDKNLAAASPSDAQVPITGSWHASQPKMLKESAEAFADYIKEHPVAKEFALLPEYMLVNSRPRRLHCYVVDADSRLAYVVLRNSKWPIFAEVDPRSVDECTEVLVRVLEDELLPAGNDE